METRYIISDASKMVDVEPHVLRYWEDELEIDIPRNEMGHRYYTDYHITLFKTIKELKDKGYLLKAIKMALPNIGDNTSNVQNELLLQSEVIPSTLPPTNYPHAERSTEPKSDSSDKLQQFESIIENIVTKALSNNNDVLNNNISSSVTTSVIKEMDYLLRLKDELAEERYKKLDETIRDIQQNKKNKVSKMSLFKRTHCL